MLTEPRIITGDGSAIAFAVTAAGVPTVTHWGAAPSSSPAAFAATAAATALPAVMYSSFDSPRVVGALPSQFEGWSGAPALELQRDARAVTPRLTLQSTRQTRASLTFDLLDDEEGVHVLLRYTLEPSGILCARASLTNTGRSILSVAAVRLLLPLPVRATELLDQTGRWTRERTPQRRAVTDGAHVRTNRRGRTGHDSPLLEIVGTPDFGFRHGEVWAAHVAWSGNTEYRVERLAEGAGVLGAVIGGGEYLVPGELNLQPGATYDTPAVLFVHSTAGIDGLSERLHRWSRGRAAYPTAPRPLTLNTWEAVYFDHSLERLLDLADIAAQVGVERFVLDDGWFQGRRDDTTGLGDWYVDDSNWPNGLEPLAHSIRARGMQFGLWFEPEMLNLDSNIARAHPDWILAPDVTGPAWRSQYPLNLTIPAAFDHLLERLDSMITALGVAFIKWDHNRDLHEPVDRPSKNINIHGQTHAVYRLMDALRHRHPALEIESCASGGARVDLGIMGHAQRVWASDTNDAIERHHIQTWTSVLLPPELVGSHIGPAASHTTGRFLDLPFRFAVALLTHAGIEFDLTRSTPDELAAITKWAALYKELRDQIATGTTVRQDGVPHGSSLSGIVAPDRSFAIYVWTQTETGPWATSPRIPLPGLDSGAAYRIQRLTMPEERQHRSIAEPAWLNEADPLWLPGELISSLGLPLPVLHPGQAFVFTCTRRPSAPGAREEAIGQSTSRPANA